MSHYSEALASLIERVFSGKSSRFRELAHDASRPHQGARECLRRRVGGFWRVSEKEAKERGL